MIEEEVVIAFSHIFSETYFTSVKFRVGTPIHKMMDI